MSSTGKSTTVAEQQQQPPPSRDHHTRHKNPSLRVLMDMLEAKRMQAEKAEQERKRVPSTPRLALPDGADYNFKKTKCNGMCSRIQGFCWTITRNPKCQHKIRYAVFTWHPEDGNKSTGSAESSPGLASSSGSGSSGTSSMPSASTAASRPFTRGSRMRGRSRGRFDVAIYEKVREGAIKRLVRSTGVAEFCINPVTFERNFRNQYQQMMRDRMKRAKHTHPRTWRDMQKLERKDPQASETAAWEQVKMIPMPDSFPSLSLPPPPGLGSGATAAAAVAGGTFTDKTDKAKRLQMRSWMPPSMAHSDRKMSMPFATEELKTLDDDSVIANIRERVVFQCAYTAYRKVIWNFIVRHHRKTLHCGKRRGAGGKGMMAASADSVKHGHGHGHGSMTTTAAARSESGTMVTMTASKGGSQAALGVQEIREVLNNLNNLIMHRMSSETS